MNIVKVALLSSVTLFLMAHSVYSQCDQCVIENAPKADFCYVNKELPELCAQFNQNGPYIYLKVGKKKVKKVPILETNDLSYFVKLTNDKKLGLTAREMLLIKEAIPIWLVEKRKIGYEFTESGLGIKIKQEGTGAKPQKGQNVKVHYSGYLLDGSKFDSSYDRNAPFGFQVGQGRVIKGWDEALQLLPVGSKASLYIPAELAYGAKAVGPIPANSILIFEIEVLEIVE